MRSAIATLELEHLYVIYPGIDSFRLSENITAVAAARLTGPTTWMTRSASDEPRSGRMASEGLDLL